MIEPVTAAFMSEATAAACDEQTQREFRKAVEGVAQSMRATGPEVETATALGRAADAIVEHAESFHADLIVLGSRGRGAMRSALLGSVSAEMVDRASCPVLVARRDRVTRVVFGDDGGPSAREAARVMLLPVFAGLPVRVVCAAYVPLPYDAVIANRPAFEKSVREYLDETNTAQHRAERIASETAANLASAGVLATSEARRGEAAVGLMAAADSFGADLIVLGTRGDRGLARLLIGSTARAVLYDASCSVLIAKQPKAATRRTDGELAMAAR